MWSSTLTFVVRGEERSFVAPFRWVSASFFETLGVSPILGRSFAETDTEPGEPCVAVVSYGFWQSRLGGELSAIGSALPSDELCNVVGIMPRGFAFPKDVDLWLPLRREGDVMSRGFGVLFGVGRLEDGVPRYVARAELDALHRRLRLEHFGMMADDVRSRASDCG